MVGSYELRISINNKMLVVVLPVVELDRQSEQIRLIACVSKHNYYVDILYIYMCVYLCTLFKISEYIYIYDKQEPSTYSTVAA